MTVTPEDIDRWRFQGHSETLIQRWIANDARARNDMIEQAQRIANLAAKRAGIAPGTPIGVKPAVIEQKTECTACHGTGFILALGGSLKACSACGADKRLAEDRTRSLDRYSSGMSVRASAQTFRNFEPSAQTAPILETCRRWATTPAGWLVIWGETGCGKSHLCASVYNALRDRRQLAVFITGPDLMASLRRLMDEETAQAEGETVEMRTENYQRAPVLIIDDMRAEQRTPWSDSVWFSILDYRYRNKLPTMIATNEDPAGEAFPARISSRLRDEHDGFSVVLRNMAHDVRTAEI